MKINIGIVATAAAKKPSTKSVKKAAAVLKQAKRAEAAALKEKLQTLIDKASGLVSVAEEADKKISQQLADLDKDIDAVQKELQDLTISMEDKEQALRDKYSALEDKRDGVYAKQGEKVKKLAPRLIKLQEAYSQAGGKDIIPQKIRDLLDRKSGTSDVLVKTKTAKKPALGKGMKELKDNGKKTGKVIDKLTGKKTKKRPQA